MRKQQTSQLQQKQKQQNKKIKKNNNNNNNDIQNSQITNAKQSSKKNPYKITINVAETQYPIVRTVAKKYKWNIVNQPISNLNFDLAWIDGHCKQQIFAKMQPYQKINHFPGMEILSRKNFLGRSLMQFKKQFQQQYDFFPLTWNLPAQFPDLKDYHDNRQEGKAQTFIVKPQASCQGRGIFLTRNIDKLKYEKCVVQRYMAKPMLIDGLKFDLRIYVLVAGTDPLRIFVYNEGLARFCTAKYQTPKLQNLNNHFMHLTNYAINKLSPDFIFNQDAKQCNVGHKRSLSSIYKTLDQLGHNSQDIKQCINDMIIKTIITGYPTLSRMQQSSHPQNFSNDMCFQILGFDVILNHKKSPFILEINYTPSFTTDSPFDKHVKKNLIYDALKLLNVNQKWKKQTRKKREIQVKERMLSGKRTKYTPEQKFQLIQKYTKIRDQHESKPENLGGFTKIFCKSQEQMLKYAHYYQFAQMLYQKQNKITGVTSSKNYIPFYMPYVKSPKANNFISQKNYTQSVYNSVKDVKQFNRTGSAFSSAKIIKRPINTVQGKRGKSIENNNFITGNNRKIISAKNIKIQSNNPNETEIGIKKSNTISGIKSANNIKEIFINNKSHHQNGQYRKKSGEINEYYYEEQPKFVYEKKIQESELPFKNNQIKQKFSPISVQFRKSISNINNSTQKTATNMKDTYTDKVFVLSGNNIKPKSVTKSNEKIRKQNEEKQQYQNIKEKLLKYDKNKEQSSQNQNQHQQNQNQNDCEQHQGQYQIQDSQNQSFDNDQIDSQGQNYGDDYQNIRQK